MTAFWLYAGLLFVGALVFILLPQLPLPRRRIEVNRTHLNIGLYRERLRELDAQRDVGSVDAVQLDAARMEAARELLGDAQDQERIADSHLGRTIPLVAALCTPLLALVLYLHWGSLDQLLLMRQRADAQSIEKIAMSREAASLAAASDSAEGWSSLGRAYIAQQRMAEAARAFERAATLTGRPAQLLGHWAEALYFADGRQWTPQLQELTDEALARNPHEATSLKLLGMATFQEGRYAEAAAYWERLAVALPEEDPSRALIADDIARARELARSAVTREARP
jgi:cytochrome c-type biogenesis protein CcmH